MNNITSPLRLSSGSHKPGSGKGCAMNVVSWENGDTQITDFPSCSARHLSTLVQRLNDSLAHPETGLLSPEDSITVLEIGHLTVGTADHTAMHARRWMHDLLMDAEFGVARNTDSPGVQELAARLLYKDATPTLFELALHALADEALQYALADKTSRSSSSNLLDVAAHTAETCLHMVLSGSRSPREGHQLFMYDYICDNYVGGDTSEWVRWAVQRFRDILELDAPVIDENVTREAITKMLTV
jgi:hypothetical protein